jgi:hypothetical protein
MHHLWLCLWLAILSPTLAQPRAVFYGQVLYEPTHRPLKDVKVTLERPNRSFFGNLSRLGMEGVPQILGTTRTNAQGEFRFSTASPGPYDISCFRPGPHFGSGALNVKPGRIVIWYRADVKPTITRAR